MFVCVCNVYICVWRCIWVYMYRYRRINTCMYTYIYIYVCVCLTFSFQFSLMWLLCGYFLSAFLANSLDGIFYFNKSFNLYIDNFLIEPRFVFIAFILFFIVLLGFLSNLGQIQFLLFPLMLNVLRRFFSKSKYNGLFKKCHSMKFYYKGIKSSKTYPF